MAQLEARNILILNWLSEIVPLATNQGVVGSNPAGRAINQSTYATPRGGVVLFKGSCAIQRAKSTRFGRAEPPREHVDGWDRRRSNRRKDQQRAAQRASNFCHTSEGSTRGLRVSPRSSVDHTFNELDVNIPHYAGAIVTTKDIVEAIASL